jgi:hypothetical protein
MITIYSILYCPFGGGVGIHFTMKAVGSSLEGDELDISGFNIGILIEAPGVRIGGTARGSLAIDDCAIDIELKNATGSRVATIGPPSPNTLITVYLGGGLDPGQIGVLVTGHTVGATIRDTEEGNQPSTAPTVAGIEVGRHTIDTRVESNVAFDELVDEHANCRSDIWRDNTFVDANESCIH